ncbi:CDP-glucose 4,6-dehydratase [Bradyrhizobium sp. AZCC 2230]|uniref:CDP-glucose 4,6-dehydratase n=1 Tax=Bradyrhizobium sp. AZCC 2230 TaxID=3117021 RepID=UPI002FEF758C
MFGDIYRGRRVLVTGHTGFKGSWLTLWLKLLGARVTGIALPPETDPNHFGLLNLDIESHFIDIRNEGPLRDQIRKAEPDVVFHMAAQPLVRRSYRSPLETWATNVMGTANVLDACREARHLAAILVVTTDKCYENNEWVWGYRETDRLGGHDPYSASKAGSELVAASYRSSFFSGPDAPLLATARAGNVIGGGDWSEDRLIPDLVRSIKQGKPVEIRSPKATRPWQHVLECLSGYLTLGQKLLERDGAFAEAWNFGPDREGNRQVQQVLDTIKQRWRAAQWHNTEQVQAHEAHLLQVDSDKARQRLQWRPVWTFEEGVAATAEWYQAWLERSEIISAAQLERYIERAGARELAWAEGLIS